MLFEYNAQPMISAPQVIEFMDGLFFGLTGKEELTEIQKCMTHIPEVADQITAAIADFEKKDLADIIKAIGEVGTIIQNIPTDFEDCQSSALQGDIQRIEKWGQIFSDPKQLVEVVTMNVLKNYSKILADIGKIPDDFSSGDFKDAGDEIADIMVDAIGPIPQLDGTWGDVTISN